MPPAGKHREELIRTAMLLFRRQGYAATGLSEILAVSGAPKGSLYHYFPEGKEAIGEAAMRLGMENSARAIRDSMAATANPAEMLRAYGKRAAAAMEASGYREGCPIAAIALEVAPGGTRLCQTAAEAFSRWAAALAAGLVRAGVPDQRAAQLGDFIVAAIEGALILARVRRDKAPILGTAEELARLVQSELGTKGTPS